MKILLITILIFQMLNSLDARHHFSQCPDVPILDDFNLENFSGTWYEIQRLPNIYEQNLVCVKADYEYVNETMINAKNSGRRGHQGYVRKADARIKLTDADEPNRLRIEYEINIWNQTVYRSHYHYDVWKTDYDNYALVYSCKIGSCFGVNYKREYAWILSRTRKLNSTLVRELEEELMDAGVDVDRFIKTDQSGCDEKRPYFRPKNSDKKSSWKEQQKEKNENENFLLKNLLRIF